MALTTFGAIMGFAGEVVGQRENVYKALVEKAKNPALKETLYSLLNEADKNQSLMEQTRRENVTEMILEPIAGLNQEDYQTDLKTADAVADGDLLKTALLLEERERKFFSNASTKLPLPEVARIFRKIAQKKERNLDHLRSITLPPL
jgi:rubrerythrin